MKKTKVRSIRKGTVAVKNYTKASGGHHVVPSPDGWKVKKANSSKAIKKTVTKAEALEYATKIAKNQKTELFIHGKNGRIQERNSYGRDSFPPRG